MHILEIKDLHVKYSELEVVAGVDAYLDQGQWLMIAGPNGAGKSTILTAISGGVSYTGEIRFKDENIRKMRSMELARHIGVLSQNHSVGYDFTVSEVVNLGRYAYKNDTNSRACVERALKQAGLKDLAGKSVLNLSGGEVQRTFLAQLFAQDPDIMILDEPANHLDLVYQKQVFELISEWVKEPGRAVISVVHDLSLAKAYGTHCLLMNKGNCAAFGPISDVLVPEKLNSVYEMDVYDWLNKMLGQWKE